MTHYFHWIDDEGRKGKIHFRSLLNRMIDKKDGPKIPNSCTKCGDGAFWRKSEKDKWHCYSCNPPPVERHHYKQFD